MDTQLQDSAIYDAEKTAALFCIICNRFRSLYEEARERAPQLAQPEPGPPVESILSLVVRRAGCVYERRSRFRLERDTDR